jgi:hypothetical protein
MQFNRVIACRCPCHEGSALPHPVPCCSPCSLCGTGIPNGVTNHRCPAPNASGDPELSERGSPLVHGLTRYDTVFAGAVTVVLMGICVVSGAGTPLFIAAIAAGAGAAVWRARSARSTLSIKDDDPPPKDTLPRA